MALSRPNTEDTPSITQRPRIIGWEAMYVKPARVSPRKSRCFSNAGDGARIISRATTTARKLAPLAKNAPEVPMVLMATPPRVGPRSAAPFQRRELSATALGSTAHGTSDGNSAWRAGPSKVPTAPLTNVKTKICHGSIWPV